MSEKQLLVLLVDDNDDDNFFHKRAIEKTGLNCAVDICTSGLDALDYLQNKGEYAQAGTVFPQPDVVFLDINMPKLDGWGFLEAYEQLPGTQKSDTSTVIVMLTTSSSRTDQERALSSSTVKAYMEKPLRPEGLLSIVDKYITTR